MITARIRRRLTHAQTFRPLLRFRVWFIPLVVLLLAATGWWMRRALEDDVRAGTAENLQAILDAKVTALELWLDDRAAYAAVLSRSADVRAPVAALESYWRESREPRSGLLAAPAQISLRAHLAPLAGEQAFDGFAVVAPDGTIVAAHADDLVGVRVATERVPLLARVLDGQTVVTHPFRVASSRPVPAGQPPDELVLMVAAAPVGDEAGRIVAILALLLDPELDFTRILRSARLQTTGETYAFDRRGLLISRSRFDDDLRRLGLIPPEPASSSLLGLEVRDPGGGLPGRTPPSDRAAWPLTRAAAAAVAGGSGVDVEGYRNYRGALVAGAWTWLEAHEFGVVTEIGLDEALALPSQLRRIFWTVIVLFVTVAAAALGGTMLVSRMGRQMTDALQQAQQLGQYTLEQKLGEGGMGQVYRARHAMLRRPTAVKLLNPDRADRDDVARFEREVQITSDLTHPNTIVIFDYGRTPDGVFYYAMEYLPGLDLGKLVSLDGPQEQGRVIHVLRQVCGSLEEAHAHGLIHRDIKPENVILCERGGLHDVAKVLDFGIVKVVAGKVDARLTAAGSFTGTPLYVPPEAWSTPEKIDARADIYALGAVAYLLLTGQPVFDAESAVGFYEHHVRSRPVPLSERPGARVSPDLEALVLRCLAKDRDERPQSARELERALAACEAAGEWTEERAGEWWAAFAARTGQRAGDPVTPDSETRTATVVVDRSVRTTMTSND